MKKAQPVALAGGGNLTQSFLARLPALPERLGPVKAGSLRVASRIANILRGGYAVREFIDFVDSAVVLIAVPPDLIATVVNGLAAAPLTWPRMTAVLCSADLGTAALGPLKARGATVASLSEVPGFEGNRYLVEGPSAAVRALKPLLENGGARIVAIDAGCKEFFRAGISCSSSLMLPQLATAVECLKRSGIAPPQALAIVERGIERSIRSYSKAGRYAFASPPDLSRVIELLRDSPVFAEYLRFSSELVEKLQQPVRHARAAPGLKQPNHRR